MTLQGHKILDGIDLDLPEGMVIGLLGPNGSGKTTILRLLAGELAYTGGAILLGKEVSSMAKKEFSTRVAVVPQHSNHMEDYAAQEVVLMGCFAQRQTLWESQADLDVAAAAMRVVGVEELASRSVLTLSGGELQRVLVARALCQEAPIQLWDEPMAHLDVRYQQELGQLAQKLARKGTSLLVACHDVLWTQAFCDLVIILKDGKLVNYGETGAVLSPATLEETFGVAYKKDASPNGTRVFPDFSV